MSFLTDLIPDDELAEHWFSFRQRTLEKLQGAYRSLRGGVSQQALGERIHMSPAVFSRCLRGKENMTLRTMHNIARAMNYRLDVELTPLQSVPSNRVQLGQTGKREDPYNPVGTGSPNKPSRILELNAGTANG